MISYFDPISYVLPANLSGVLQPAPLALADADALADNILRVDRYKLKDDATRAAALAQASMEIDSALRYRGRKYIPEQLLEFPRAWGDRAGYLGGPFPSYPVPTGYLIEVDDWDYVNNLPIIPAPVLRAVILQAASIFDLGRTARIDAIHDGLASQSTGPLSESYSKDSPVSGAAVLCRPALTLVMQYRLTTGRLR